MKFHLPFAALLCAGSVSAMPLTTPNDVQHVRYSEALDAAIVERTYPSTSEDDCDCDEENPISSIVDEFLLGGDISAGLLTILGDAKFGTHVLDLSLDASFLVKLNELCGSADFIAQLDILFKNDAFLDKCSGIVADGKFAAQIGLLFTNADFVKRFSAGISADAFVKLFGVHFGANFDFAAKINGLFSNKSFVNLFVSLCGKGAIGGKLGVLFGDVLFRSKFAALLSLKGGFGAGLGGLLADVSFMTHICGKLGFSADLTAKFVALFGAKVGFAGQLEAILGAGFKGKFTAIFGSGSCTSLLIGFFGKVSFNDMCHGAFKGGAFFKAWAKLCLGTDFAIKFCGLLSGYVSGKIGFAVWVGQIFADKVFCVALLGLFGIKSAISAGLCAILGGGGLLSVVTGFIGGMLGGLIGGSLGFVGKVLGLFKGGHSVY